MPPVLRSSTTRSRPSTSSSSTPRPPRSRAAPARRLCSNTPLTNAERCRRWRERKKATDPTYLENRRQRCREERASLSDEKREERRQRDREAKREKRSKKEVSELPSPEEQDPADASETEDEASCDEEDTLSRYAKVWVIALFNSEILQPAIVVDYIDSSNRQEVLLRFVDKVWPHGWRLPRSGSHSDEWHLTSVIKRRLLTPPSLGPDGLLHFEDQELTNSWGK